MNHWRTNAVTLALTAWLTGTSVEASLVTITSDGFGPADPIHFAEFDPTLGTLDSVNVTINGVLTTQITTAPNLSGPFGTPVPYSFSFTVEQDFFRGATGRGFELGAVPTRFFGTGTATGNGETQILTTGFSYGFSFTEASDLLGGLSFPSTSSTTFAVAPPSSVQALLSDFLPTSPSLAGLFPIETLVSHDVLPTGGIPFIAASATASGAIVVQYDYTPAAAPEPSAVALVALAVLVYGARGVRRGSSSGRGA